MKPRYCRACGAELSYLSTSYEYDTITGEVTITRLQVVCPAAHTKGWNHTDVRYYTRTSDGKCYHVEDYTYPQCGEELL
jgi:hypothetical protein